MAETGGNFQVIDEELLAECVSSAIHQDKKKEKGTLLRQEQETKRSTKERESPVKENLRKTETNDSEPSDSKSVISKYREEIDAKATVRNNLLGDRDPRRFSESHFSPYYKMRSEISAVYKPNLKQNEKCMRMMPYRNSNGRSSDSRRRFEVGSRITTPLCHVSDHDLSDLTSIYSHNKNSTNSRDIDLHRRSRKDDIQELIFKIYSEQEQTLEELLRCKTQSRYRPRHKSPSCHSRDVLNQSLSDAPAPPRFLMKNYVFSKTVKTDDLDVCKVAEGDDYKEELFDAFHVPYFKEKQGIAKQLDELFSFTWSSRINFV